MKQLQHPHLMRTYGLVKINQSEIGIVMELCGSHNFSTLIRVQRQYGELRLKKNLNRLYELACGLNFMHLKGISHFDIKPSNFFFTEDENPVIGDFGLSRSIETSQENGTMGFTLPYCSPEQLKKMLELENKPSDVWSFGMSIYEITTGLKPFREIYPESGRLKMKEMIYEVVANKRTPLISREFEKEHRVLVGIMRECWVMAENRLHISTIRKRLKKII